MPFGYLVSMVAVMPEWVAMMMTKDDQRHAPSLGASPGRDDRVSPAARIEGSRALRSVSVRQGFSVRGAALTHHARVLLLIVAATVDTASIAAAQTTRAEADRAKREAKASQLIPERRSKIEALLFKIDDDLLLQRIFNPPRGIHARVGGIAEGAGFGGGPGYQFIGVPFDFRASAAASLKGYFIAQGSLRFPGTQSEDFYTWANGPYVEVYARRRDFPQEDFYGIGPDSSEDARSNFALRDTFIRVTPAVRRGYLTAGANLGYLDPSVGSGTDTRMPSTDEIFGPEEVPGLNAQPAYGVIEPFVEFATFDRAINDRAGGRYRLSFTRYEDRDLDQFSFSRWDVDLRQFIPFVHDTHALALRAWASSSDPSEGDTVPFYLQPTLGGAYSLRGFRALRFRDRSALLLQAEYRWRINEFVEGALFYDTGAVGPELGDIGKLERDYGFGLRAGPRGAAGFRLDVAFGGREGTRFLVRFDDVF
jgi:Omp85 superfamily domain